MARRQDHCFAIAELAAKVSRPFIADDWRIDGFLIWRFDKIKVGDASWRLLFYQQSIMS